MLARRCFELSPMSVNHLRDSFRAFHGHWYQTKLTADLLEEAVYNALGYDPLYAAGRIWTPRSHNPKADIRIETAHVTLGLSIKSGKDLGQMLQVSGHRLSQARENLNRINTLLCQRVSDVVLCFVHHKELRHYACWYIDASVFRYPQTAQAWTPKVSNKNGTTSEWHYTSPAGLQCSLKPAMSWQIWWTIPTLLCRPGPLISYRI